MKKTITLFAGSFLWLGLAAQSDPNPTFKTEALGSRLIATNAEIWSNATWRERDSTTFTYSGTRGGDYNGTPFKADMTTNMVWDSATAAFKNTNRTTATYNAANEITTATTLSWDGTAWQNIKKTNYTQSGLDRITLEQYWKSGAWMDSVRTTVSKNANGNTTQSMNEIMVAGAWAAYTYKTTTTYNARNLAEQFIRFNNVGGVYVEDVKFDYNSYDAADNLALLTVSNWVSGAWAPGTQTIYGYDANRNQTKQVSYSYVSGTFVPTDSTISVYNLSNQKTDDYRYLYNSGAYTPQVHSLFQYDLQGNQTLFQSENWVSGAWEPSRKTENQFNASNKQTQRIDYNWVSGAWENSTKYNYVYDANNNILEQTTYNWVSGAWQGSGKTTWMYNANNLSTQRIIYNASAGVFVENVKSNWDYNSLNKYTTNLNQKWVAGAWENIDRGFYYYEAYQDGVGISESSIKASAVYPNPFTKNTLIDFSTKVDGDLTFTVTDINGRVMHSENNYYPRGANSILFDGENLSAGVYIYTLSGKAGKTNGRILKK